MYTTYHLASAQEVSTDILDAIKLMFKSKPITITIEEEIDATNYLMSNSINKAILDKSLKESENGELIEVKL